MFFINIILVIKEVFMSNNKKLPEGITEKMLEDARKLEEEVSRQMKNWKPRFGLAKFNKIKKKHP